MTYTSNGKHRDEPKQADVVEKFVRVGSVMTHTMHIGQLGDADEMQQRYLMLVIPGNPGVPTFYEDFIRELYNQSGGEIPVWAIGHAGHTRPSRDRSLSLGDIFATDKSTYGLEAQINHKVAFIREHVPSDVKLILIGHSIGCYMILNSLEKLAPDSVERCYMLFPTIERMALSPNGSFLTPIFRYFRYLVILGAFFISLLPKTTQEVLIKYIYRKVDYPDCMTPAIVHAVTPWSVNFSTFLAKLEMGIVTELQKDLVKKHEEKLSLYYGASDLWAPVHYYEELIKEFPNIDARFCELNMKHAFVMLRKEGPQMAEVLWQWIRLRHLPKLFSDKMNGGEVIFQNGKH